MIRFACAGAVVVAVLATAPPASALTQPVADPAALPHNSAPSPTAGMQLGGCSTPISMPGTAQSGSPATELAQAWKFSRGEGQTVAIIDTGVKTGPRLHAEPGGDYIQSTDGLTDCDGHGTLVAGIIGAQPGDDGFSGVAPAARLVSIRQVSAKFSPRVTGDDPTIRDAAYKISTLARAIVHAADLGARVINVSAATCVPVTKDVDQSALGAALRYAAVDKDAVIVAAAGDTVGAGACKANPLGGSTPEDPRNWTGVESISAPSWWQPYVLSVGSVAADGTPSKFTMPGPWIGIAAPGENVTSISNADGASLASAFLAQDGKPAPISGTGYAAAYVSGVAALVRSRYPELKAADVISRLQQTSRNAGRSPSNLVGVGTVDPVAALTWDVSPQPTPDGPAAKAVAAPQPPAPQNPVPRRIAFAGLGICALAVVAVAALAARRRQENS